MKRSSKDLTDQSNGKFDLRSFAQNEASNAKHIPSYEALHKQKHPEFLAWLSGLRERIIDAKRQANEKGITAKCFIVIGCGGTFQSAPGPSGYEPTGTLEESFDALQLPKDDTVYLEKCNLMNLDSSQMTVEQWRYLAEAIVSIEEECGDLYEGIIVTHGTDTMAKGASYVSFMLRGFPKSIVFTGSQHPARQEGTDAKDQMQRAIDTSKLATNVNKRITEVMIACGLKVARATWATKQGDLTTNAFGPWNEPHNKVLAGSVIDDAAANGTLHRLTPALLDFGAGLSLGEMKFARHAKTYQEKGEYMPFTRITDPADLYPIRMTDKSPASFADHLIKQRVALLWQLGSATADDSLVKVAWEAANHGKAVIYQAAFPDSTVQPGKYKAGIGIKYDVPFIQRPLPNLNASPETFEAKVNYVLHQLGLQPEENTKGLGMIYSAKDLRDFYDRMETNMVGELIY